MGEKTTVRFAPGERITELRYWRGPGYSVGIKISTGIQVTDWIGMAPPDAEAALRVQSVRTPPGHEVVGFHGKVGAIVDAIDERTLLVPISHVLFRTGEIQEIEPIIRRAHEVGAHVILDCYQSAGIVPFDVTALNVDFAVGGSVKWLNGGPGDGWL